jgi:hypothetical protein
VFADESGLFGVVVFVEGVVASVVVEGLTEEIIVEVFELPVTPPLIATVAEVAEVRTSDWSRQRDSKTEA